MDICSIILAAGEGKRMKSKTAKPLLNISGKPILEWVLKAAQEAGIKKNIVVAGHKAEDIKAYFKDSVEYALQENRLGTGHALLCGIECIEEKEGTVAVLNGDAPLLTGESVKKALAFHKKNNNAATVVSAHTDNPFGYGRVIRNGENLCKIVEEKDAAESEKKVCEINSGIYFFDLKKLLGVADKIDNNNAQGEYYITDFLSALLEKGEKVGICECDFCEVLGVNDRVQLAEAERIFNKRNLERLMLGGVTIVDPNNTYTEGEVFVGCDTIIYPGTTLGDGTVIGEDCKIGPNSMIYNSKIGNGTSVISSRLVDSLVGDGVNIGPFAYLRPNSKIGDRVKIGDFVEVKNSVIDEGTKVSHLTYVGDSDVGKNVNFGCGTVTVNYDGINKHRTVIGDNAFIGCNSNLVAPVKVAKGAYTAAGSTITDEVPEDSLAVARARQINKQGWVKKNNKLK